MGPAEDEDFAVWPENWDIVQFWRRICRHWVVVSGLNGTRVMGLDWTQIESKLHLLKIEDTEEMVNGLEIMEHAALKVING